MPFGHDRTDGLIAVLLAFARRNKWRKLLVRPHIFNAIVAIILAVSEFRFRFLSTKYGKAKAYQ